jgi:hypothetical protein
MKYKLRIIRAEIQETDDFGSYRGQGLTVEESIEVEAGGFMEVAGILGRFHELGEEIKARREIKTLPNGHTSTCTCPGK